MVAGLNLETVLPHQSDLVIRRNKGEVLDWGIDALALTPIFMYLARPMSRL